MGTLVELMGSISINSPAPARAPVVPRGSIRDGEVLALETHIRAIYRDNPLIAIVGAGGSGKSTAIAHLAAALSDLPIEFSDETVDVEPLLHGRAAIVAGLSELPDDVRFDAVLRIAPWGEAERIDYLLARHSTQVRSVMDRLKVAPWIDDLEGSPRLWSVVLDKMAEHASLTDVPGVLRHVMNVVLAMFGSDAAKTRQLMATAARGKLKAPLGVPALLQHPFMLRQALIDELYDSIDVQPPPEWWHRQWDEPTLSGVAARLAGTSGGIEALRARLGRSSAALKDEVRVTGPLVTVMLAVDPSYRPTRNIFNLDLVVARGLDWSNISLPNVSICEADLRRANLAGADLSHIDGLGMDARGANLSGAKFVDAKLDHARFDEASLDGAVFVHANLRRASAVTANFNLANLSYADLRESDLRGASFRFATLSHAVLLGAKLDAVDFTSAVMESVSLLNGDVRNTILNDAALVNAQLLRTNFAEMEITGFSAVGASFVGADLTASRLPRARLRGASFRQAGLADVDWEGVDLRDADFTHAAFHMGSSRSGLVFSPIACEGSRTGFYTDDYAEQDYKPVEQIRKANLCGADLIGAKVTGTDWYLVDLRGAKYTTDQAEWFRKCGAILVNRASR